VTRKSWIYTSDGRVFERGSPEHMEYEGSKTYSPRVFGDEESFVSPIDRKVYSGKAGMREHNARHQVVNNRELAGLPVMKSASEYKPDRNAIRGEILKAAKMKGYMT
jgi:hypothetical protein